VALFISNKTGDGVPKCRYYSPFCGQGLATSGG
jgi:hypothetical protein